MSRTLTPAIGIGIALSLLLILTLTVSQPGQVYAQAEPAAPEAPGSIAGVVNNANGEALAGIEVEIYRLQYGYFSRLRLLTTNAAGAFRAGVLPTGSYRVRFRDPAGAYGQTYYPDAATLASAATLAIAGNDITVQALLRAGGALQGYITSTTGSAFGYTEIAALTRIDNAWQRASSTVIYAADVYSLTGLRPGSYAVCAFVASLSRPTLCYDAIVSAVDNAQPVTVTAGVTVTGIDLTLGVEGDGAAIGGVVRSPSGTPLTNVQVQLFQRDAPSLGTTFGFTMTDAAGQFRFDHLPAGGYHLWFRDTVGPHLSGFYSRTHAPETATPIIVDRYERHLDIEASLELGGMVSGKLMILGQEIPEYATVMLQSLGPPDPDQYPFGTYDASTGRYHVAGVAPGEYRVAVWALLNGLLFSGYYGSATPTSPDTGTITVTPGAILTPSTWIWAQVCTMASSPGVSLPAAPPLPAPR